MKESILGRSKFSILRMVALTRFLFFIGLGTTVAQNYVSTDEALSIVRTELHQINIDLKLATRADEVRPQSYVSINPQFSANWTLLELVYEGLESPNADVKAAIENAVDKAKSVNIVSDFYYDQGHEYLKELLSE